MADGYDGVCIVHSSKLITARELFLETSYKLVHAAHVKNGTLTVYHIPFYCPSDDSVHQSEFF